MFDTKDIQIQRLKCGWLHNTHCDVLRLDELHPVVSGNKWFKLKYYIAEAKAKQKTTVASFGGAFSNHIVATAFACREAGLHSVGIIRGEKPPQLSDTLTDALSYGMELVYVSREEYRNKEKIKAEKGKDSWLWVGEGGFGPTGAAGAKEILETAETSAYSHIICACGTGTTMAGLVNGCSTGQTVIGVSVLKGHVALKDDVSSLVDASAQTKRFDVLHEYHFGGYAKHPPELLEWMNELWVCEGLPTDIVYTGKLFYAVKDLIEKEYFLPHHKLLVIHSGGLQGNRSLAAGTLQFL